jgi:hypothetical protein
LSDTHSSEPCKTWTSTSRWTRTRTAHTVLIREGLIFGDKAAAILNELHNDRLDHCLVCTGVILKSAGIEPGTDQAENLAGAIRAVAHHNQHFAHNHHVPDQLPRDQSDREQRCALDRIC